VGAIAHEVDVEMVLVGGPVPLEIVEKEMPVVRQAVPVEVLHREAEGMIDPDHGRHTLTSSATNHSAMPRRVQYFRGLGGGGTPVGSAPRPAMNTWSPRRLEVGVSAPE
jgi:hypothetical protein